LNVHKHLKRFVLILPVNMVGYLDVFEKLSSNSWWGGVSWQKLGRLSFY